jgi:hypothetical protein
MLIVRGGIGKSRETAHRGERIDGPPTRQKVPRRRAVRLSEGLGVIGMFGFGPEATGHLESLLNYHIRARP